MAFAQEVDTWPRPGFMPILSPSVTMRPSTTTERKPHGRSSPGDFHPARRRRHPWSRKRWAVNLMPLPEALCRAFDDAVGLASALKRDVWHCQHRGVGNRFMESREAHVHEISDLQRTGQRVSYPYLAKSLKHSCPEPDGRIVDYCALLQAFGSRDPGMPAGCDSVCFRSLQSRLPLVVTDSFFLRSQFLSHG